MKIKWGKKASLNQLAGYGQTHHWQKKSIFWDLPYWPDLLIRHNLDLMHLEKNVAEDIFYIVVNIASRTKDNKKARKDLTDLCNRPALHLTPNGKKTMAPYALELEERRKVLKWLKEKVKFPDGYASNWGACVNLTNCTVSGLKSHDFHIFMERLLPAAFRDFIPDSIWGPLCELSRFFREICAKELDPHRIDQLGQDVIVTLCKLEKIFPPSFFNSMQHLIVHVAYEAKVGGPVNCRWMYGVERNNKLSKNMVTNKARVEGCMVQATLIKEIAQYCSAYFSESFTSKISCTERHKVREDNGPTSKLSIFDTFGGPVGRGSTTTLSADDYAAAHTYVLLNCPEIQPWLLKFDECMLNNNRVTRTHTLEKLRQKEFADWLHKKALVDAQFDDSIRRLALMPSKQSVCYNAYDVNGFRFHTEAHAQGKSTTNSGVCVKGEGSDNIQRDYYGILQKIIELEYQGVGNKVVLFKCRWFNITNGIRVDEQHGFVEVKHTSTLRGNDNFVYACQAIQVYYLPYASDKRQQWWIAMKTRRKEKFSAENVEAIPEFFQEEHPDCHFSVSIEHDHYENPPIERRPLQPLDISYEGNGDGGDTDDEDNYDNDNVEQFNSGESDEEEW